MISLEVDPKHADVARKSVEGAAPGVSVEVRLGDAVESLRAMIAAREEPFDVVFIDADKGRYVQYLDLSLQLCRSGSIVLGDNLIRHGLVLDASTTDERRAGRGPTTRPSRHIRGSSQSCCPWSATRWTGCLSRACDSGRKTRVYLPSRTTRLLPA